MSTYDEVITRPSLSPAARSSAATVNGVAVDRMVSGGTRDAVIVVTTGTVTDGTHTVAIEDSDNGSTGWATVPAAQLQGSAPAVVAANDDTVFEIGVISSKRYLRVNLTTAGATTGAVVGATVLLGGARYTPISHA